VTALEQAAAGWVIEVSPQAGHLLRTRDWAVAIDPRASEAVRVAALLHDIERAFPDRSRPLVPARDWHDRDYLEWHQARSASIAGEWLRSQRASDALVSTVEGLIGVHEDGGWPEADVLQAADSLSFLETMADVTADWVRNGADPANAEAKLQHMVDRIRVSHAKAEAERLLVRALGRMPAMRRW
jgi:hypothetical protein